MNKFKKGDLIRHTNNKHKDIFQIMGVVSRTPVTSPFAYQVHIINANLDGLIYFEDEHRYQNIVLHYNHIWDNLNA